MNRTSTQPIGAVRLPTLRARSTSATTPSELEVLVGFDDDLNGKATRITNRSRGLLTGIHQPLNEPSALG